MFKYWLSVWYLTVGCKVICISTTKCPDKVSSCTPANMTLLFQMSSLNTLCLWEKRDFPEFTQYGWTWLISRCLYLSGSVSYLNLARLSNCDFLYRQDKEVPRIGAITELMEIREPSSAFGGVWPLDGWTGTCAAILLAESLTAHCAFLHSPSSVSFNTTCLHVKHLHELFGFVWAARFKASREVTQLLKNACVITGERVWG